MNTEDRRRNRSQDPLIALHYQLSRARHDGAIDTLVLADPSGVVVAGAGSWAACEELAAYAPLFARPGLGGDDGGGAGDAVSSRIAELRAEVSVRELTIAGQEVLLCARGRGADVEGEAAGASATSRRASEPSGLVSEMAAWPKRALAAFDRAADGVSRILSAA